MLTVCVYLFTYLGVTHANNLTVYNVFFKSHVLM